VSTMARIKTLGPLPPTATGLGGSSMRTSGIEELKSVLRRSALLIVAIVLLGVVAMNVIRQVGGPHYQADARVLLDNGELSNAVLGINPAYQDPARQDQAEQNVANSPQLYEYAARRVGGKGGTADYLMNHTAASVANNVVSFTAVTDNGARARFIVNTVASAYPSWRARVAAGAVDQAIKQVQAQIARFGKTPTLQKQLQQLQVLRSVSASQTLFVDKATDAAKTSPKPVVDTMLGAAIGLVIALLVVGGRELFDTTVRSESDVEDALEAPVLATIDSLPRRLRAGVLGSNGGRFNDEYDLLAAKVAQAFEGQRNTVHLAVTSAVPGEGKTTTATNLAAALARRGGTVVLADFDLRKPAVSEFVGIPRGAAGVTELLSGSADLSSVLWHVQPNGDGAHVADEAIELAAARGPKVAKSAEGSLSVMPGGAVREAGTRFAQLPAVLERLPRDVDFVVVDTPPALLVAGMADLAQSVDAVIVVVRHGLVHRRRLRSLGRQARSWRARLLGAVLNDTPGQEGGYSSYYYGRS
jgi:Mrp family chromosome partitioning ATPase